MRGELIPGNGFVAGVDGSWLLELQLRELYHEKAATSLTGTISRSQWTWQKHKHSWLDHDWHSHRCTQMAPRSTRETQCTHSLPWSAGHWPGDRGLHTDKLSHPRIAHRASHHTNPCVASLHTQHKELNQPTISAVRP